MKILIVDDVAYLRMIIKDILVKHLEYNSDDIIEATDGPEAIKKYKQEQPALVLCDVLMPDMTGVETVEKIINIDANAKIIMCTSVAEKQSVVDCINLGALGYILKPPSADALKQEIEKAMVKP